MIRRAFHAVYARVTDYSAFRLTGPGRIVSSVSFIALMLAVAAPQFYIFVTPIVMIFIFFLVGLFFSPRVTLTGSVPARAVAGTTQRITFEITNRSRLPAYDVALNFFNLPDAFVQENTDRAIPCLAPGETVSFTICLRPLRRGVYTLYGPRCFTTFPFNIMRFGRPLRRASRVTVIPGFHTIDRVELITTRQYFQGGITLASKVGDSPEYIGNRDYRPGDSPRKIDSRAWARLAAPAVKEYHDEYFTNIAVVLDTWLPGRRRIPKTGEPRLEAAVSLTAAVVNYMSRDEYLINLFAAGPVLYRFRTGRHTTDMEQLLDVLATVRPCTKNPFDVITPALVQELNQISEVVFFLLDFDKERKAFLETCARAGCTGKVFLIRSAKHPPALNPAAFTEGIGPVRRLEPDDILKGALRTL